MRRGAAVMAAALTGLFVAAVLRVGAPECYRGGTFLEESGYTRTIINECLPPVATWWGVLLGAAVGAAAGVLFIVGLRWRRQRREQTPAAKGR